MSKDAAQSQTRTVHLETAIGWVQADLQADQVVAVGIVADPPKVHPATDPLAQEVLTALQAYFQDGIWPEGLPIKLAGTPFQQRVWACLRDIPPGQTRRYGDVAETLGSGARAVGNACRANPLLLLVPCHRVVAAHGRGGFAGQTQGHWPVIKDWLLQHESARG